MKYFFLLFGTLLFLTGCTDVEGYEVSIADLENEVLELTENIDNLEEENKNLSTEIDKINNEKKSIKEDFDEYKERMSPYEELEEAEANARKIEAEKIAAKEKEEAEKKKAEEEAAKQAEAEQREKEKAEEEAARKAEEEEAERAEQEKIAQGYETGITYEQLARTPDEYFGEQIKFSGRVVQVIEGADEIQLRFAVNDDYDQVMYLAYSPDIVDQRVLEDDYLIIYGYSIGTISYESTMSGTITIPASIVDIIEFN